MKTRLLFKGPLLTRSGYGEQSRFALRALRSRSDLFDIFIQPLSWGKTSWITENDEERQWIDEAIERTIAYIQHGGQFDASFQITIPNEWENHAPINIGFTAGIETTQVDHTWIQKGNEMHKIIVVSEHSKKVFENTVYSATDQSGRQVGELKLNTPVEAVNYAAKKYNDLPKIDLDITTDFNFLSIAQLGPRKNVFNNLTWFVEEFHNENVGLILKTNLSKNCIMDREKVFHDLKRLLSKYPERLCKVYLMHGDMDDKEIHSLYNHPKIDAYVTLTHGEGFGLPLFESVYSGLPVIAPGWSGHLDFLVNKNTGEDCFYNVEYDLANIPDDVVWEGVLIKESMWAYPREHSVKQQMRRCYSQLTSQHADEIKKKFTDHAEYVHEEFSNEKKYAEMVSAVTSVLKPEQELLEFE